MRVNGHHHNGSSSAVVDDGYRINDRYSTKPAEANAPTPLEMPPLPALPGGIFDGWLGSMIYAVAAATETPPELAATFALGSLATATQGRFCVRPEPGYLEPLAFWIAAGLPPASRKTAVMMKCLQWAFDWQRRKAAEIEPEIQRVKADHQINAGRIKDLRAEAIKCKDDEARAAFKAEAQAIEESQQPIPVAPRLTSEDCTSERLVTMLAEQNERMGVFSDEGGLFDTYAGRYSNGVANIDVVLKGHSESSLFQDRGSRAPVYLSGPLLTFAIAPQPAVLAGLINNQTFRRRGLPARFIFLLPDARLGYRTLITTPVPDDVANVYAARLVELAEMDGAPGEGGKKKARPLNMAGDAYGAWKAFAHTVERAMQPGGEFETMTDWAGKLAGACARLAGLLHLAEHGPDAIRLDTIELASVQKAVAFCWFAVPHAKAVFGGLRADDDLNIARRLWKEVESDRAVEKRQKAFGDPGIITARELWHPHRSKYKCVADIEGAIRVLLDHNFLNEMPSQSTGQAGRPSRRFRINPAIARQWDCGNGDGDDLGNGPGRDPTDDELRIIRGEIE